MFARFTSDSAITAAHVCALLSGASCDLDLALMIRY
jgi:hypothetical protein